MPCRSARVCRACERGLVLLCWCTALFALRVCIGVHRLLRLLHAPGPCVLPLGRCCLLALAVSLADVLVRVGLQPEHRGLEHGERVDHVFRTLLTIRKLAWRLAAIALGRCVRIHRALVLCRSAPARRACECRLMLLCRSHCPPRTSSVLRRASLAPSAACSGTVCSRLVDVA